MNQTKVAAHALLSLYWPSLENTINEERIHIIVRPICPSFNNQTTISLWPNLSVFWGRGGGVTIHDQQDAGNFVAELVANV